MGEKIAELAEKLGKLRRNEEQMTPEQKKQYAKSLMALKKQICADASDLLLSWCLGGLWVIESDQGGIEAIEYRTRRIIEEEQKNGEMKRLGKILLSTYSIGEFLAASSRLCNRIRYEAYGPYWVSKCEWNLSRREYWNPIIQMWWDSDYEEWVSEEGSRWTLMLPPTEKLLKKRYQEEKDDYERWAKQRGLS